MSSYSASLALWCCLTVIVLPSAESVTVSVKVEPSNYRRIACGVMVSIAGGDQLILGYFLAVARERVGACHPACLHRLQW